jgi:hypothetical protein
VLWNIKNFLEAGKTAATQEKIAYFLAKYFPRLSVGFITINIFFTVKTLKTFTGMIPADSCGTIALNRKN